MKKFFNLFIGTAIVFSASNCTADDAIQTLPNKTQSSDSPGANLTGANRSSVVNYSLSGYKGQLPYLRGAQGDIAEFRIENELDKKIADAQYSWVYFDSLYQENLNVAQKQLLAYVILSKKDLISEFNTSPTQTEAEAIAKYTDVLVETNYFGYCLMFNCLKTLKNQSFVPVNINSLKQNILANTTAKQYHEGSIQHFSNFTNDQKSAEVLVKIKEDLQYLDSISNL